MKKPDVKISPSKLELVSHCAAAALRCAPFPFEPSEASERGKKLHEAVSSILLARPGTEKACRATINEQVGDEDFEHVKTCLEVAELLEPSGKKQRWVEQKLDLKWLGMPWGGTPDLAYYDEESGTMCVIDWKFGRGAVPDPEDNKQLHAYLLALVKAVAPKPVNRGFLVVCQPCGKPKDSYRQTIIEKAAFEDLEANIKEWVFDALTENPIPSPGPHCKKGYCMAGKKKACPEFAAYDAGEQEVKEAKKDEKAKDAVSGFHPIVLTGPVPTFPIVIFSEEAVEKALDLCERAEGEILDQFSADGAGLLLNEITSFEGQIDRSALAAKRPQLDLNKRIGEQADVALVPLRLKKADLKQRLDSWVKDRKDEQDALVAEQERKKREAEQARLKAEQEAQEAQRKAERDKTAASVEAARKAQEEANKRAEESRREAQQTVIVETVKVAGTKTKQVPEFEVLDFPAMPDAYKIANEKLLKTAIETGALTGKETWISVKWVDQIMSSGRKR